MIRTILLILFFAAALAPQAQAQPSKVCDGRFERMLAGYRIGAGELDTFLQDREAFAACRAQFDANIAEHRLIAAWLVWTRGAEDLTPARQLFDAACREKNDVACYYAANFEPGTAKRAAAGPELLQRLRPLVANVPAAAHQAGFMLLRGSGVAADRARGEVLLAASAGAGDRWAAYDMAMRDVPALEQVQAPVAAARKADRIWLQRAADGGHIPAAILLSAAQREEGDGKASFDTIHKAATADAKFFTRFVAEARLQLALRYAQGTGVEHNPDQVRLWVQRAADLGNEQAKKIMQGK